MFRLTIVLIGLWATATTAYAIKPADVYFSCKVREKINDKRKTVTVKFLVTKLNPYTPSGSLGKYPGTDEDDEYSAILVDPVEIDGRYSHMSNLNSQGGDLRFADDNLKLWGDGDGYQFTDLVIWDVDDIDPDEESGTVEGYVRDYGPAYYPDIKTFKQFITCKWSTKAL